MSKLVRTDLTTGPPSSSGYETESLGPSLGVGWAGGKAGGEPSGIIGGVFERSCIIGGIIEV